MQYDEIAILEAETPRVRALAFQHVLETYVSETNKTNSIWRSVPEDCLDFRPHDQVNTIRTIFVHQILSERRFFSQFVGLTEPGVETLLPTAATPTVSDYCRRYVELARRRLPQFAAAEDAWWLEERPFFGLVRQRVWIVWRRILHTCHHRTQVQTWLRLAGQHVPAIYGPSGDVSWSGADPTYSLDAAGRGG